MNRLYLALAIGIMLAGTAAAQNVEASSDIDTMILVSTANYPDAMISASPAEKLGIPVLLTDKDQLSTPAENAINRFDPSEVIIVGGPAVISEQVKSEVDQMTNTTRLWGTTQIGSSTEVSSYFWTSGSEKVTIVQYPQDQEGHSLLATVKNEVDGDGPILVSKEGTLSASVLTEVERLGATEAEVYSTDAVNVTSDLEDAGVEDVEVEEAEQEELRERLKQTVEVSNKSELVIVAAGNFRDTISVPVSPNSASYIVSSESQIDGAVNAASNAEAGTTIKVVGKPDLASQIADRIESETDKTVSQVSGTPEEAAASELEEDREQWKKKQMKKMGQWKNEIDSSPGLMNAANKTLQRARDSVDENSSEEAREMLQEAEDEFEDGDYFKAKKLAIRAASNARVETHQELGPQEVRQKMMEEREDVREAVKEMKENAKEMAEELREAESPEERMEIIREYRQDRKDSIKDLKERFRETQQELRENEIEIENEGDSSELKIEAEPGEIKAEASYTANTGGYNMTKDVNRNGNEISFTFNVVPPSDGTAVTQVITELEQESELEVEAGEYNVSAVLNIDGKEELSTGKTVNVTTEEEDTETEESENSSTTTVTYTDSGFSPQEVEVEKGETVVWEDESSNDMWVATDRHPSHTNYDGTSKIQHCESGSSDTFDQCSSGASYSFTFDKTGEWSYHNHENAFHGGTVEVE